MLHYDVGGLPFRQPRTTSFRRRVTQSTNVQESPMPTDAQALMAKIQTLPPDRLAEVEDFVDFLRLRDQERTLIRTAASASAPAFAAVWDNPEDDAYDAL